MTLAEWWAIEAEVDGRLNEQADAAFAQEVARARVLAEPARNPRVRCSCWAKTKIEWLGGQWVRSTTAHVCKVHG
jgi:hypothetical protein